MQLGLVLFLSYLGVRRIDWTSVCVGQDEKWLSPEIGITESKVFQVTVTALKPPGSLGRKEGRKEFHFLFHYSNDGVDRGPGLGWTGDVGVSPWTRKYPSPGREHLKPLQVRFPGIDAQKEVTVLTDRFGQWIHGSMATGLEKRRLCTRAQVRSNRK